MPLTWDEDKHAWAGGAAITNVPTAAAAPTQAEFNTLVDRFNALLAVCRDAGLIALD
jgi:hypothetical protein